MPKSKIEKQKEQAIKCYQEGQFIEAFETLFDLPLNEALPYFERKRWFINQEFWDVFMADSKWFTSLIGSPQGERLTYLYYAKSNRLSPSFEYNVASIFPEKLVRSVRRTRAFLEEDRIHHLLNLKLPEEYQLHQKVWEDFYQEFIQIGSKIEQLKSELTTTKIEVDLAGAVVWLEQKRFNRSDMEMYLLAATYSRFIEHYFNGLLVKDYSFNNTLYTESFLKILSHQRINPVERYLNALHSFTYFTTNDLEPYAFDDNCIPVAFGNGFKLDYKSKEELNNWRNDEARYGLVKLVYKSRAAQIVNELEKEGELKIPKGKLLEDEELNRAGTISEMGVSLFLMDLELSHFSLEKKTVPFQPILSLFNGLVVNLKDRYERHLLLASEQVNSFQEAYLRIFQQGLELDIVMISDFTMAIDEFVSHCKKALPGIKQEECEDLITLFSYTPDPEKTFDLLRTNYDIWFNPFLKFKNHIFCPTFLLARNSLHFPFAQAMLKNNHQTKLNASAKDMEKSLVRILQQQGWKAEQLDENDPRNDEGDVDVLLESEKSIVLIQLKRTFFRTDLESAYNEAETRTRKAAQQLRDAHNTFINAGESRKVHQWIVSTSFENLYQRHEKALKLNYFEIIQSFHVAAFNSLEEWIEYMENDRFFIETAPKYEELLAKHAY